MEKLNSRYRIEKVLGKGGMGEVYLASDEQQDDRKVAVKKILTDEDSIENHRRTKRFEREYQFLSAVDHPNIVKAYDFFRSPDSCYLVLEFVEGKSLKEILRNDPPMSIDKRMSIASQLVRGVEVLHTAGVIHRDLKPDNVMVNTETGGIKILDLGIGRSMQQDMSRLTETGEMIGTVDYMSPEQVSGKIKSNSDIFSLGTILYQLFLWQKQSPFHKNNAMATIFNISQNSLPPLHSQITEDVSEEQKKFYEDISVLLEKAMQKEWRERTPKIQLMAEELEKIYENHPSLFSEDAWGFSEKLTQSLLEQLKELEQEYGTDLQDITTISKAPSSNKKVVVVVIVVVAVILALLAWKILG